MKIENKVAIVTGASSGIGRALAGLLSERGAKVALVARSKEFEGQRNAGDIFGTVNLGVRF